MVADIGGTNARFAVLDSCGDPARAINLATAEYPGPVEALHEFLHLSGQAMPDTALLAVAGPVSGDEVAITNLHWRFSIPAVQEALGLRCLRVINDFEALARSLPRLGPDDVSPVGEVSAPPPGLHPKAVIGPGTGLGMAGLVPLDEGWKPVPSEGGYTSLAPWSERELAAWRLLRKLHGRVSAERVLCGPGLVELYQALARVDGMAPKGLTPKQVVSRAAAGDCALCQETLEIFCAWLGDVAGDAALMFSAWGGVFLAGGILPAIADVLQKSAFRRRFENKGRGAEMVKPVPTYLITTENPALLGCAQLAAEIG